MNALSARTRAIFAAGMLALASLAATPAAQAFSDDEARKAILELREQLRQTTEQNRQARLQLADQIEALRTELAHMRGQLEQLHYAANGGQPANGARQGSSAQASDPQEQAAYEAAAQLYRSGKYGEAADGFASFVQAYPDSPLAGDATFYLGSSQYATRKFADSVKTMNSLVSHSPNDPRAPDALLVAAASQIELNDMAGAKASLQQIIRDYPQTSAAETAKSRLKLL